MKNLFFPDMVIQSFLYLGEFWGYLPISVQGYGIFKVILDARDRPSRASLNTKNFAANDILMHHFYEGVCNSIKKL